MYGNRILFTLQKLIPLIQASAFGLREELPLIVHEFQITESRLNLFLENLEAKRSDARETDLFHIQKIDPTTLRLIAKAEQLVIQAASIRKFAGADMIKELCAELRNIILTAYSSTESFPADQGNYDRI